MIKYRLYHGFVLLYEGLCSEDIFSDIKKKYAFGQYRLEVIE